ncbi:MAG: sigma-70 family RNA polymerase sigma factor [Acidobacteriota bacterium]
MADPRHHPQRFATTRWSMVLRAGEAESSGARRALEDLCALYWHPLYAYARRRGHDEEDARDLTQAFFGKLLAKGDLRVADPARGRFRTFLLTAMKNFLAGEWRKDQTRKRGGNVDILPFDFDSAEASYRLEPSHETSPERLFERRWALAVLDQALVEIETHYRRTGRAELFDALKEHLMGDVPYAELAEQLAMKPGAVRTAMSRLRSRWRERLRALIAETVDETAEVEDELGLLVTAVC